MSKKVTKKTNNFFIVQIAVFYNGSTDKKYTVNFCTV